MRAKTEHLKLLLQYLEKELVEEFDMEIVNANFASYFSFKDVENRECEVTIYDSMREMPPDLSKKMQLHSRVKKENT